MICESESSCSVPAVMADAPARPERERVPAESCRVAEALFSTRLSTVSLVFSVTVYVPASVNWATSRFDGRMPPVQLVGVVHDPPEELLQGTVCPRQVNAGAAKAATSTQIRETPGNRFLAGTESDELIKR